MKDRGMGVLALVVGTLLFWGCGGTTDDGTPDSAADQRSQEVSTEDLVDLVAVEVLEVAPESTPDEVAQADENTPDLAADQAEDTGGFVLEPPTGPPPEQWDCSADWDDSVGRLSPVPLGCILDPSCTDKMVVAHRGAGGQLSIIAPENSLGGIRAAILMGVDGVELDVRLTADEELILMHDGNVLRTTGVDAEVEDLTAAEITALPLLAPADKYAGDFSCETVPTFDEAMELIRGRLFVDLDCKTSRTDLIALRIVELDLVDQVFVSVGNIQEAVLARETVPGIRIQVRPDTMEEVEEAFGLFDRVPEIFEVPWDLVAEANDPVHAAQSKLFADAFGQDAVALVLNDLSDYQELYDQGADVLQTEFPTFLLSLLGRE